MAFKNHYPHKFLLDQKFFYLQNMKKPISPILIRLFALLLFFTVTSAVYLFFDKTTIQPKNIATSPVGKKTDEPVKIPNSEKISPVTPYLEPEYKNPIELIVNGDKYITEFKENINVYKLMQNLSADSKKPFYFTTKEYIGMGMFIEEINGIKNDATKNQYWIYYINGQSAKTGISNYIIHKGDAIEWKYEKSKF